MPHTHTHPFNGPLSGTTRVSRYQKGKSNLDFTEARDSEWQWHQLGDMHLVHVMPLPLTVTPSSVALFKSRLVLPFWYRLIQVVLENCACSRIVVAVLTGCILGPDGWAGSRSGPYVSGLHLPRAWLWRD